MNHRVIEFDIVRALAIFLILLRHLPQHSFNFYVFHLKGHSLDLSFIYWGEYYLGLGLFAFISGYLLSKENPSFKTWGDMKQFVLKRYIRIFPLYIAALLLFVALNGRTWHSLSICSFVLNLLGLQIIFASKHGRPFMTLWFVGLILSYYYLFIILVKLGRGVLRFITLAFTIFLFSALLMKLIGLMDERFLMYFGIFVAGIMGARYKLIEKMNLRHLIFVSLLFAILLCLYGAIIHWKEIPSDRPSFPFLVDMSDIILHNLFMLSFVFIAFTLARVITHSGHNGSIQKIAYASYGIYLFHRPVWWIMEDIYCPTDVKIKAVYLALLGIPLTIFVSYYLQKFYDKHFKGRLIKKDSLPSYLFGTSGFV
jgi:peptidoglycan/LPS O-acetylase OafA/YrhL